MFNPDQIKKDFPLLSKLVHGLPLVYLDNAATSQKPLDVIDAITNYYQTSNANVHRGVHALSDASTVAWESARRTIATFFGAQPEELIVVRNTTEAMNGVAQGWGANHVAAGDVIITTELEHHSNFVVWQQLALKKEARLELVKLDEDGRIQLDDLRTKLTQYGNRVKAVCFVQVSNTLGVEQPLQQIVSMCNKLYSQQDRPKIIVDAAQAAPHQSLNFDRLDVDFLAFSGHKMLGPMGFGGLLVKRQLLESNQMKPWLFGGGMISSVEVDKTEFHPDLAERFTAGTPDVASAVGMAAACDYLSTLGMANVEAHDRELVAYALEKLAEVKHLTIVGPQQTPTFVTAHQTQSGKPTLDRLGSVTFIYEGVHAHDVAQILDSQGIAVRSGHHCTMPYHLSQGWQATVRASFQVYTSRGDIDALVAGLAKVATTFGIK